MMGNGMVTPNFSLTLRTQAMWLWTLSMELPSRATFRFLNSW